MDRSKQDNVGQPTISPLAKDKTYGEKKFDLIFGTLVNFWINLTTSAVFAFYAKHSVKSFDRTRKDVLTGKEFNNLRELQNNWIDSLSGTWLAGKSRPLEKRMDRAESIINVMTLLTPGHLIMIPSVWLGEKFKAPIVEWFDRRHYGSDAMNNPDLKARHDAIAIAEKPTLLGTTVGRFGAALVNIGISASIGERDNLFKQASKKIGFKAGEKFNGIDNSAENVGHVIAEMTQKAAPKLVDAINNKTSEAAGYSHSRKQIKDTRDGKTTIDLEQPYHNGFDDMARYFVQDIMYTLSTAAFIKPIVHGLRHILPGMTYKPEPKPDMDLVRIEQIKLKSSASASETDKSQNAEQAPTNDKPTVKITHGKTLSTIAPQPELTVAAG